METKQHVNKKPNRSVIKSKRKSETPHDKWKWKYNFPKSAAKVVQKVMHIVMQVFPKKTRNISNKTPNLPTERIRKKSRQSPKSAEGRK